MYRTVLCLRYLMRRWLTLVAVLAVFLGVGTLVVVLAIMGGIVTQVREAIRGGLSDVIIDSDISGFPYYDELVDEIRKHPNVRAATPVIYGYGPVQIAPNHPGYDHVRIPRLCVIYGVRPAELAAVSRFGDFLTRQKGFKHPTLEVPPSLASQMKSTGQRVWPGCIPGKELVTYHPPKGSDEFGKEDVLLCRLGAELVLTTFPMKFGARPDLMLGGVPKVNTYAYTVVDHYESRLLEFDRQYIFIPFEEAQRLTGMDVTTEYQGMEVPPRAQQLLVRLHDYDEAEDTINDLKLIWEQMKEKHRILNLSLLSFLTWEQRQAELLGAVEMERTMMVMVVGLVVLVAAFLIGAMLSMIVKEKTRDIGILKSLGASNFGAAQIFLLYGLIVSTAGSLLGLVAGLVFTDNIDAIERWLSARLDREIFARGVYYFDGIPTHVDPFYTGAVVIGAILMAVLCSAVAAYRAARLQPVEALRYE